MVADDRKGRWTRSALVRFAHAADLTQILTLQHTKDDLYLRLVTAALWKVFTLSPAAASPSACLTLRTFWGAPIYYPEKSDVL